MKNQMFKKLQSVILLSIFYFLFSTPVFAARVYFEPSPATYKVGDSFTLSLLLDTEGQSINALDISIQVPKLLKIKNISKNGSIIQLWISEPSFSGEIITLTGGIPSGTTTSKGTVVKVTFEAAAIGEGNIAFTPGSSILLNDGQGTKLDLEMAGGPIFQVVPKPKETMIVSPEPKPKGTPIEVEEIKDNKKPEKFKILISEDSRIFDGQKFISFFSTDKDSGIEHYEVKEGKSDYKIAQSPYLLGDQNLRTVIRTRAYDGAGNYRESVYPNLFIRIWWWITGLLGVL
jgi:hypothetical protein